MSKIEKLAEDLVGLTLLEANELALTTPTVMEPWSPKGLPRAMAS